MKKEKYYPNLPVIAKYTFLTLFGLTIGWTIANKMRDFMSEFSEDECNRQLSKIDDDEMDAHDMAIAEAETKKINWGRDENGDIVFYTMKKIGMPTCVIDSLTARIKE
jgi:hypothetical protein